MKVTAKILKDDGTFPNNSKLPLLHYQAGVKLPEGGGAAHFERKRPGKGQATGKGTGWFLPTKRRTDQGTVWFPIGGSGRGLNRESSVV
jgi:hypothetical protein